MLFPASSLADSHEHRICYLMSHSIDGPLAFALSTLLEPSSILTDRLVPELTQSDLKLSSYAELIDAALDRVSHWSHEQQAQFIAGHPRIGETKALSHLSAKEQAERATPPEVLARLAHLNACYERKYEGLRYITFVNGRSRAEIAIEMEEALGLEHSFSTDQPPLDTIEPVEVEGDAWKGEVTRAVGDSFEVE
ncbi:OHCU decarboxylase-domain-containing protein [Schizophyllum amplum]|uniref:OHCU decarboxylase-domain-containing protein n=1 Tax=Schizophyllum amplum TaxID=97359 RepID=A0A550CKF4_9AGAR|nr:OHCU decarboxylase-domain-containing protein [Auriculariopsis ampla]